MLIATAVAQHLILTTSSTAGRKLSQPITAGVTPVAVGIDMWLTCIHSTTKHSVSCYSLINTRRKYTTSFFEDPYQILLFAGHTRRYGFRSE